MKHPLLTTPKHIIAHTALLALLLVYGCQAGSPHQGADYETVGHDSSQQTELAQQENTRALVLIEQHQYPEAEALLKKALAADVTFGPAHNNLGKAYYHQSKFYLAAWEFQYAIKLMPYHPEPRNNLGLVFEAVGKLNDAVAVLYQALDLQPDNPQLIGNLARVRVRRGDRDYETRQLLSDLIMKDTRPDWVAWAREKLALMDPPANEGRQ